jgi:2'-5' RNA ligase
MRAFCALNLDVASVRRLEAVAVALRAHSLAAKARWVPPTRMHVTVKFFGDVDVGLAPALRDAIVPIAEAERAKSVGYGGLAGFPQDPRARVIVALLDDAAGYVARVAHAVEEATSKLGFEREARVFSPHVTLARLERPTEVAPWMGSVQLPADPALLTELVLYRSDFSASGHEYVALARFGLLDRPPGAPSG